jgi:hypothetical protein
MFPGEFDTSPLAGVIVEVGNRLQERAGCRQLVDSAVDKWINRLIPP